VATTHIVTPLEENDRAGDTRDQGKGMMWDGSPAVGRDRDSRIQPGGRKVNDDG
jgi:hypothetical protein